MSSKFHILLLLLFSGALVPCTAQVLPNEHITALDTINSPVTQIYHPPSHADSMEQAARERNDRLYKNLKDRTGKRAFPKFLIHSFYVSDRRDTTSSGVFVDEAELFRPFNGKTIGTVTIDRHQIFDNPRSWLQKATNNTHHMTRRRTIRRDLLFKSGDEFSAEEIVKNSQLIRSRNYIYDLTMEVTVNPVDTTLVDINIVTRDSWTVGVGFDVYDDKETTVTLFDANFLGTGNRLAVKTNFKWDFSEYGGNVVEFRIPNVLGTFFRSDMKIGKDFDDKYLEFDIRKDFILPTDYGAGFSLTNNVEGKRKIILPDSLLSTRIKSLIVDAWFGKSRWLPRIKSSIFVAGRYLRSEYMDRPEVGPTLNPAFHNGDQMLMSVGLYNEKFYSATMITGYGFKEYLGTGYRVELVGGHNWGEFYNEIYLGSNARWGGFTPTGYLLTSFSIGSYLDRDGGIWQRSALDAEIHWFSNLMIAWRSRLRQFVTLNYTHGWNRMEGADQLIRFTSENGPRSFTYYVAARNRLSLNSETVFFTPFQPLGFKTAVFAFADMGLIGNDPNPFRNVFYTTLGLGVRIKNERLIFNTIQFRFGVALGKGGWFKNDMFSLSNMPRNNQYRFIPQKPETVAYF